MNSIRRRIAIALICIAGCSSHPGALRPPRVNPAKATQAAISEFDRNGDGELSKAEWSKSPELTVVAKRADANGDDKLTADEIRAAIEEWQQNAVGPRQVPFSVSLNDRPLSGATVRLVPAEFFGPELKPATSETGPGGGGFLTMAPEDMPPSAPKMALVEPGWYRVEVTHPTRKIPARYNTESTLGIEITSSNPGPQGVHWSLSSP